MTNDFISDNELINSLGDNEEEVKNILFERYNYIIDIILKKYTNVINTFQMDSQDIRAEALLGFSDGINSFNPDKETSLKTFLTLCIERRVIKYIIKNTRKKAQVLNEAISLDYSKDEESGSLMDTISDENKFNPLDNLETFETMNEIMDKAKCELSDFEYQVFTFMVNGLDYQSIAQKLDKTPKQIDNTIQRVKLKMKEIIEKIK